MSSSRHERPTILLRGGPLSLVLLYTILLLPLFLQPTAARPTFQAMISHSDNTMLLSKNIAKRGIFNSTTGATIGGAVIIIIGVAIGLGCALIAVCGFPWKLMCGRSRYQDEDKGKEKETNNPVNTTTTTTTTMPVQGSGAMPPQPLLMASRPNNHTVRIISPPVGQSSRLPPPPPAQSYVQRPGGMAAWAERRPDASSPRPLVHFMHPVSPAYRSGKIWGHEYHHWNGGKGMRGGDYWRGRNQYPDDTVIEEQFYQQGAQPRGYV